MSEKVCNGIALLIMAVLGIFHTIIEAMGV